MEQKITITKSGLVQYCDYKLWGRHGGPELHKERHFKVPPTKAQKLLDMVARYFSCDYQVVQATDIGHWTLWITNTDGETFSYGKRWDIEVFFKTSKSVLRLTCECRSLSYDAMCAQCAIVFARYMFLAVGVRENQDLRSAGPLFCLVADELADISFAESMAKLQLFLEELLQGFNALQKDICALIMEFLADLPVEIAEFLDLDSLKEGFKAKMGCEV